jgi:hypothetical protein
MKSKLTILSSLLVLLFLSCHKSTIQPTPPATVGGRHVTQKLGYDPPFFKLGAQTESANNIFAPLKNTPVIYNIPAGTDYTISGNNTQIQFYPNSFVDANGNIISGGNIQISMIEASTPGQMIANRALPLDNTFELTGSGTNSLLISRGEVCIEATRNGNEVFANSYRISFKNSTPSSQPMRLFYGNAASSDSLVKWTSTDTTKKGTTVSGTRFDTASLFTNSYRFDSCHKFHWINCDYFYSYSTSLTDVTAITPDTGFNSTNTMAYIIFPTINSILNMSFYNTSLHAFSATNGFRVPVGMSAEIVAIARKGSDYYYCYLPGLTVTTNMSVNLTMGTPKSLADIKAFLATL